jgi:hypothetical protein
MKLKGICPRIRLTARLKQVRDNATQTEEVKWEETEKQQL